MKGAEIVKYQKPEVLILAQVIGTIHGYVNPIGLPRISSTKPFKQTPRTGRTTSDALINMEGERR